MSKKGKVFYKNYFAGTLTENEDGYTFSYDGEYLNNHDARPISLVMPLREEVYSSKTIFPFFDGLIPEGWLLDIAEKNWKINPRDRMELLLAFCRDSIGAVGVERLEE